MEKNNYHNPEKRFKHMNKMINEINHFNRATDFLGVVKHLSSSDLRLA